MQNGKKEEPEPNGEHEGAAHSGKDRLQHEDKNKSRIAKQALVLLKNKNVLILILSVVLLLVLVAIAIPNFNRKTYEEYDLKGLTIKEACEKVRSAGWEVHGIYHIENYSDKTDCYNTDLAVSNYDYYKSQKKVDIYYGERESEEDKKAKCEAEGKWYRNSQCKTEEEWENEYKWQAAHSACKKYGANGYAKTLTDCYVGDAYMGSVDGQPASESSNNDAAEEDSESNPSNVGTPTDSFCNDNYQKDLDAAKIAYEYNEQLYEMYKNRPGVDEDTIRNYKNALDVSKASLEAAQKIYDTYCK